MMVMEVVKLIMQLIETTVDHVAIDVDQDNIAALKHVLEDAAIHLKTVIMMDTVKHTLILIKITAAHVAINAIPVNTALPVVVSVILDTLIAISMEVVNPTFKQIDTIVDHAAFDVDLDRLAALDHAMEDVFQDKETAMMMEAAKQTPTRIDTTAEDVVISVDLDNIAALDHAMEDVIQTKEIAMMMDTAKLISKQHPTVEDVAFNVILINHVSLWRALAIHSMQTAIEMDHVRHTLDLIETIADHAAVDVDLDSLVLKEAVLEDVILTMQTAMMMDLAKPIF